MQNVRIELLGYQCRCDCYGFILTSIVDVETNNFRGHYISICIQLYLYAGFVRPDKTTTHIFATSPPWYVEPHEDKVLS